MNFAVVLGIMGGLLLIGLMFFLKKGFIILLGWLALLAIFGFIMFAVYKWIFPPNWKEL